jgi:hypothetical protein
VLTQMLRLQAVRVYPMPWQSLFLVDYPLLASFLGTDCRSAGGGHLVRVLSRKHSACRGPLEWWHQLRWRDRIIFADLIVIPIWRFLKTGGPENVADDELACRRGTRALGGKQSRRESAGCRAGATKDPPIHRLQRS